MVRGCILGPKVAVTRRVCDLFKNWVFLKSGWKLWNLKVNEDYEISKICSMVEISVIATCIRSPTMVLKNRDSLKMLALEPNIVNKLVLIIKKQRPSDNKFIARILAMHRQTNTSVQSCIARFHNIVFSCSRFRNIVFSCFDFHIVVTDLCLGMFAQVLSSR